MDPSQVSEELLYTPLPSSSTATSTAKKRKRGSDELVESFLSKAMPPKKGKDDRTQSKELKHQSLLLDQPAVPKRKYNLSHGKNKKLTVKEKKELKLFKLDPSEICYDLYLPLHELWKDYMRDLLKISTLKPNNMQPAEMKLLKADYHGSIIMVTEARNPSLVGLHGIVLQETKNTFKVVTKEDKLKTIPKSHCIFTVGLDGHLFTICGTNFLYRTSERASRSFKMKYTVGL